MSPFQGQRRNLLGLQRAKAAPKNPPPHFVSKVSYNAGAAKNRLIRTSAAPAVQNPDFNTPKIAKRLVRNCRAKKCCIFSLKYLDVNNLIHNFAPMVKIGCTSAKLTSKLAISALGLHYLCRDTDRKVGETSAFLSPRANYKSFLKLPSCAYGNLLKHQTMKSFVHITPCTLCPSAKPVFACVEGTRFTPPHNG